jgi:hypothetical protein
LDLGLEEIEKEKNKNEEEGEGEAKVEAKEGKLEVKEGKKEEEEGKEDKKEGETEEEKEKEEEEELEPSRMMGNLVFLSARPHTYRGTVSFPPPSSLLFPRYLALSPPSLSRTLLLSFQIFF